MGAEPFVAVSTTGLDVLAQLRTGSRESIDRLVPLLYEELRAMAHRRLLAQPRGGTLQTTALVHEAYLKIVDQSRATVRDRVHFLALASLAMRHVLVDRAKARGAVKRDGQQWCVTLDEEEIGVDDQPDALLQLDDALTSARRRSSLGSPASSSAASSVHSPRTRSRRHSASPFGPCSATGRRPACCFGGRWARERAHA